MHIDPTSGAYGVYLNYYAGTAGTRFCNGANGVVGNIDSSGNMSISGTYRRNAAGKGYLDGGYSAVETSTTSGCIYTIGGASYNPTATTLGNMYGIGYGYSGQAGINVSGVPANAWGMYAASSGTARVFLNSDNGIIYASDFSASSDQRLKTNITPLTDALDKIKQLNGVTFNWNELSKYDQTTEQVGVLAQEVEKVLPQAVSKGEEYMSVSYGKIVPLLIESIKEQQSEIDELKSLVKQLLKEK